MFLPSVQEDTLDQGAMFIPDSNFKPENKPCKDWFLITHILEGLGFLKKKITNSFVNLGVRYRKNVGDIFDQRIKSSLWIRMLDLDSKS